MNRMCKKTVSLLLAMIMILSSMSTISLNSLAANDYTINSTDSTDGYYNLISKKDWDIAPGITESEIVLNNDDGSRRQVLFVMEADLNNEYVKVINSYMGMVPKYGDYKIGPMSEQAKFAEENGYGNVVGAMNTTLSWYSGYAAERVNEPLGFIMLDAEVLFDPANCGYTYGKVGFPSVLVINKDFDDEGNRRPSDIPKVEMPQITSAEDLDGWEEQVIPCSSGYIVKDGKNLYKANHTDSAPRSVVGIKADGTVVTMLNDGRQVPYSDGMSMYELAEVMLDLGCIYAVNCDGGGSSTFLSQRPGEELKINNSPSDGAERSTTTGILFISTAPSTGEFARATISSDNDYYTPGSTVKFTAFGTDLVGSEAEIPENVDWALKDSSKGTIENGVFVSNGTTGDVTVQMLYNGNVVGEDTIHIVIPDTISLGQNSLIAPYGKSMELKVSAQYDYKNVSLKAGDVSISLSDEKMGVLDGFNFTATTDETVKNGFVLLSYGEDLTLEVPVTFGKGSEVIFDFEGYDTLELHGNVNSNDSKSELKYVTKENGQVKSGNGALAVKFDFTQVNAQGGWVYAGLNINQEDDIVIPADAVSWGLWIYIPEEAVGLELDFRPWHNVSGSYKRVDMIPFENGYATTFDESGWHYVSVDVSTMNELVLPGTNSTRISEKQKRAAFEFYNPDTGSTANNYAGNKGDAYRSINGTFTVYLDDMIVDYSTAVEDRELPGFSSINVNCDSLVEAKPLSGQTINSQDVVFFAKPEEDTTKSNYSGLNFASAKAYIDGVDVTADMKVAADGSLILSEKTLKDGVHTVKFSIEDMMGNYASIIRQVKISTGSVANTIKVQPKDDTLDRIAIGSVYYMDVVATDIASVQQVEVKIDINNGSEWEPLGMEVTYGFTASCTVDPVDEIATIIITKTGEVEASGEAVLVSIPARTWESRRAFTPQEIWASKNVYPQDMQFTVKYGLLKCTDGSESSFSAVKHYVVTELDLGRATQTVEYWNSRNSWHIHIAGEAQDKAATCTENGYTGRVYCVGCSCGTEEALGHVCAFDAGCNSVIEWGTVIPATGHEYGADGKCKHCDKTTTHNGLVEIDGVWYYYIDNVQQSGWIMIDTDWYYFNPETKAAVSGSNEVNGITYDFEENGKLVSGVWATTLHGMKYYYGPSCYGSGWAEIDGNRYFFENTYRYEGYRMVFKAKTRRWYNFGDDGICREDEVINGFYWDADKGLAYVVDNVGVEGLHKIDGEYYFFNYYGYAVTGKVNVGSTSCDLPTGTYYFGEDYKAYNGLLDNGSSIVYYENGRPKMAGLVEIDGEYYFAGGANGEITVDKTTYVWKANGLLPEGEYAFDAEGKLVNGIAEVDGVLCYYENGKPRMAGLIEIDGDLYFAYGENGELATGKTTYVWKTNGLLPAGNYTFDEDGKLLNGISDIDGVLRYYKNGQPKMAGLVEIDGEYYFAGGAKGEITTNKVQYVWKNEIGVVLENGNCEFDADGKMLNGIVEKNGTLYYYVMGRPKMAGLIEVDGAYYFAGGANGEITVDKVQYVWKNEIGVVLENENCEFGADGKMLNGIVEKDGTLYYYVMGRPKMAGLIEIDGAYYFAGGAKGEITANKSTYVWKANGILAEDTYEFGADGKMLNGIVEKNGTLYYYENGKPRMAGLVEIDGAYYFAGGANGEITVNKSTYVWKANGIMAEDTYEFGADGKMLNGFVTKDDGIYYYENGKFGKVGLNLIDGEYYFINYGGKLFTNGTYYVWKTNGLSICMNYTFDELGRVVR